MAFRELYYANQSLSVIFKSLSVYSAIRDTCAILQLYSKGFYLLSSHAFSIVALYD